MGHKSICINCRKAFNQGSDFDSRIESNCPECGQLRILMPHSFRPPKKTDNKKWEVVEFLINNGFRFQHISKDNKLKKEIANESNYVQYPTNLNEAKEFVIKYKEHAIVNKTN